MTKNKETFFNHLGQTSDFPLSLEISHAEGIYMYTPDGTCYTDLISGLSVNNIGHCHPEVVKAIQQQSTQHLHLMVYGELIQSPQTELAQTLTQLLPDPLQSVYIVNSGSEAIEGALKLAKRYTRRTEILAFKHAYHGGTQGALSLMGDEYFKQSFRPLLPDIRMLTYNNEDDLTCITQRTACIVVEPIQAEAGIIPPDHQFMQKLAQRCKEQGALLILDEVQTGMKRTGPLFAFYDYGITPDMLVTGKALGGGMPIGAFIASKTIMDSLKSNPVLGHITTFGGHPLACAAANTTLNIIARHINSQDIKEKENLFRAELQHPQIKAIRGKGLFLAVELSNSLKVKKFLQMALQYRLFSNSFIFNNKAFRIAPPLIITKDQIKEITSTLQHILDQL